MKATSDACRTVLEEFLRYPISDSTPVLKRFSELQGAISCFDGDKNRFVYVPGNRKDRVVLVAHADTVWDSFYTDGEVIEQTVVCDQGVYRGKNPYCGIGADDRAGCAILWLLRDSGHSLLVTDGEEHGQIGSHYLRQNYPEIFQEINKHHYIIQLDRRGSNDFKTYDLPVTKEFVQYIHNATNYEEADKRSRTDIVALCDQICGVNLSVGYYHEHLPAEKLVFDEWLHTLQILSDLLEQEQKKYKLQSFIARKLETLF